MTKPKQWPGSQSNHASFFLGAAPGFAFALLGCLRFSLPLSIALPLAFAFGLVSGNFVQALHRKSAAGRKPWIAPLLLLIAWSFMLYVSRRLPEVRGIERSLSQESSAVQQLPGLRLYQHNTVTKHDWASVNARFTGIPAYGGVKAFYQEEMGKRGWNFKAEVRFPNDNHLLVFCKGPLKAEVFYDSAIHQELLISFMGSINGGAGNVGYSYNVSCP
jgi:hypothetical protein